jgi:hypothetical protein
MAIGSRRLEGNAEKVWSGFAVIEPIRNHAKSQRLDFGDRLLARATVDQNTWEISDLGDPATIVLLRNVDPKIHHRRRKLEVQATVPWTRASV